jgi:hypothetical protein
MDTRRRCLRRSTKALRRLLHKLVVRNSLLRAFSYAPLLRKRADEGDKPSLRCSVSGRFRGRFILGRQQQLTLFIVPNSASFLARIDSACESCDVRYDCKRVKDSTALQGRVAVSTGARHANLPATGTTTTATMPVHARTSHESAAWWGGRRSGGPRLAALPPHPTVAAEERRALTSVHMANMAMPSAAVGWYVLMTLQTPRMNPNTCKGRRGGWQLPRVHRRC